MKSYTKKGAIAILVLFVALFALVLYTATMGYGVNYTGSYSDIKLGLDLRGGVSITYQAVEENPSEDAMQDTIRKLKDRVEGFSTEAVVYQEGNNRITVDIPGETDADEVLEQLGTPGSLVFCTNAYDIENTTILTGDDIENAQPSITDDNEYIVYLAFTDEGQKKFQEATKELAGTGNPLYIIYDGSILSYPTVEAEITSKYCSIEGSFTYDQVYELASYIRIGALPVELEELRSSVVGASLGTNAIQSSLIAGLIGLALICVLMIILYRLPGFVASLSLVMYTGLIVCILAAFNNEITLTLPGIAGIILSIGMAVDANVIIFSRIREEIGTGSNVREAIQKGFEKALSAIVDGNVTTLIAAVVLFLFGSGTVKGFAVTLALGIVLSMFTALVITKLLLKAFYAIGLKNEKLYGKTIHKKAINFLSKKNFFFIGSIAVILIGIGAMVINGTKTYPLNYSLDFVGGTATDVEFNEAWTIEDLEKEVKPEIVNVIGTTDVSFTPVVGSNNVIVKTPELTQEYRSNLYELLETKYGVTADHITYENISATVSAETSRSAILSVVLAAVAMLIYIWIRFRDIRFATSSILALVHDCLVVLACYALFRWTVGSTFIACMLTLVGYSINATIVIFDRIRENLKVLGQDDLKLVVNTSITETLTRSIYTSLTTAIMVAALLILGVESIREFALPLLVGIVVGGYSSVCLAGAMWYAFKQIKRKKA